MKSNKFLSVVLISFAMLILASCDDDRECPALVPSPTSVEFGTGVFKFSHDTVISVEDQQQKDVADWFAWLFARPAGFVPEVRMDAEDADVVLGYDSTIAPEAYKMIVTRKHIHIYASDLSGFLYAFQTLRQALPDSIGNASHSDGQVWAVPVMTVYDAPRYMHRCLKLDVTYNHIPLEEVMTFVEYMAMLKLNHLHLFGHDRYSAEEIYMLENHASAFNVNVVCGDGMSCPLYSCPDDIVSRIFPSIAALAEVAWSDREVIDRMGFNRAVDAMDVYLSQSVLGYSKSVYDIGLAALR